MKLCPTCGINPRYTPPKGRCTGYCRQCWSDRANAWNKKNKRQYRDRELRRKFGITIEEYDRMLQAQGGLCAICRQKDPGGRDLAVDHVHDETKRIRGLLCVRCNIGIGQLQDSPAILQRAIDYLNQ
jgi:Recombination endonuclease VII